MSHAKIKLVNELTNRSRRNGEILGVAKLSTLLLYVLYATYLQHVSEVNNGRLPVRTRHIGPTCRHIELPA
jgi:hypothetical protein